MTERNTIIEGGYLRDLLDQPAALRDAVAGLAVDEMLGRIAHELQRGAFERVVGAASATHLD